MATRAKGSAHASVATAPGEEAAEAAFATLRFGEGARVGVLGDSGTGKTHAMRHLVRTYLRLSPGPVMVIDDKGPKARFEGVYRRDRDDLMRKPVDETKDGRVVVFRGDQFAAEDGDVDPESIARLQLLLAKRKQRPSLVVYDELDKAADGCQWKAGKASTIAWAFGKGRDVLASSLWGTQETEAVPRQAFNQSNVILCFRLVGNPVRLLKRRDYLRGGVEKVIPGLPGEPLPPSERGKFVLLRRGQDWDGKFYRFEHRRR